MNKHHNQQQTMVLGQLNLQKPLKTRKTRKTKQNTKNPQKNGV